MQMLIELFILAISCQFSTQTEQYVLLYERMGDLITLKCRDTTTDSDLPVGSDENVRFWVNRTRGIRFGEPDIQQRNDVQVTIDNNNVSVRFLITRALEGYYSCGNNTSAIESDIKYLISLKRNLTDQPLRMFYSQSGGETQLLCPSQPGNLRDCYFGRWLKDSRIITEVQRPLVTNAGLCTPQETIYAVDSKYHLDRSSFSLIVQSIEKSDGGNYHCELSVLNPESVNRDAWTFKSPLLSLKVDEEPFITIAPEDTIVGIDDNSGVLSSMVMLNCTAIGIPPPSITWTYNATLSGEVQRLTPKNSNITSIVLGMDPGGRHTVMSVLSLQIFPTDGGMVTCIAGFSQRSALLTVLGAPTNVRPIVSFEGDERIILYEITLPVALNRPVKLNISYENDNEQKLSRVPSMIEFNDTESIFFHDNMNVLPFKRYHVIIALQIAEGSQFIQGPSLRSETMINTEVLPPTTVIGLGVGLAAAVIIIILIIIIIVIIVISINYRRNKIIKAVNELLIKEEPEVLNKKLEQISIYLKEARKALRVRSDGLTKIDDDDNDEALDVLSNIEMLLKDGGKDNDHSMDTNL